MIIYTFATVLSLLICFFSQYYLSDKVANRSLQSVSSGSNSDSPTMGGVLEKLIYAISFLPLFLISAFRWNTGTDLWHTYAPEYIGLKWKITGLISQAEDNFLALCYSSYFNDSLTGELLPSFIWSDASAETIREYYASVSGHTSIAFRLLQRLLIAFDAAPQWLFVVTSLIILSLIAVAIYRQSSNKPLAILLFVITSNFFLSLNIISQFLAISICLVACEFAEKRKPIPFFILVALAFTFHSSAIVFLIVYFLPKIKVAPKWNFLSIAVMLCAAPLLTPLAKLLVEAIVPKYARYFSLNGEFEWIFFGIGMLVFLLSSYYYEKLKDKPYFLLWYNMNVVGIFALCFSAQMPEMKRINYYFAACHFLLLPLLIQAEDRPKIKQIVKWGIIAFFLAETIVAVGVMNKNGVLPYTPFWAESYESLEPFLSGTDAMLPGSIASSTDMLLSASDIPSIAA